MKRLKLLDVQSKFFYHQNNRNLEKEFDVAEDLSEISFFCVLVTRVMQLGFCSNGKLHSDLNTKSSGLIWYLLENGTHGTLFYVVPASVVALVWNRVRAVAQRCVSLTY